jgi:hypothetical protein
MAELHPETVGDTDDLSGIDLSDAGNSSNGQNEDTDNTGSFDDENSDAGAANGGSDGRDL